MKVNEILLKAILIKTHYIEQEVNTQYFAFKCNLKEYFVYLDTTTTNLNSKDRAYQLFCYTDFRFIEPMELISSFCFNYNKIEINEETEIQMYSIDQLEPSYFSKVLGRYLKITRLENLGYLHETVNCFDCHKFSDIPFLSKKFFASKEGFSLFTYPQETAYDYSNEHAKITPNGLLFFNKYNCNYIGNPTLRIHRKGRPEDPKELQEKLGTAFQEQIQIVFSPYTLLELHNLGYSYYKDNFLIIGDPLNFEPYIHDEKTHVHLRPTLQELYNYIVFINTITQHKSLTDDVSLSTIHKDEYDNVIVKIQKENFSDTRNKYKNKLDEIANKLLFDWQENMETENVNYQHIQHFNFKLLKKKIFRDENNMPYTDENLDAIEIKFKCTVANCYAFIQYYLFEEILSLKQLTTIYYNPSFDMMSLEEEEFLRINQLSEEEAKNVSQGKEYEDEFEALLDYTMISDENNDDEQKE